MARRKKMLFDPNIEDDIFDYSHEENLINKKKYRKGRTKRKLYTGI